MNTVMTHHRTLRLSPLFAACAAFALSTLVCRAAKADRELIVPFEESGHLVLDQLSGFRVGAASGFAYAGPVGISYRSTKSSAYVAGDTSTNETTTTMWLAPSVDLFVTDYLSIGALVEVSHSSGTGVTPSGQSVDLPGTLAMTFMPRIGFYAPIGDRFGIWPRAGIGWSSVQEVKFLSDGSTASTETFRSLILDVDLTVVYRFTETFFMRVGPEVGVTLGGRKEQVINGNSFGADKNILQFSGVIGFGANLEL